MESAGASVRLSTRVAVLVAVAVACVAVIVAARLNALRALELRAVDWRLSRPHAAPTLDDFVIVALTRRTFSDPSLERWGPTALARSTYARVIDRLTEAGPRAIALDIFFSGASDPATDAELAAALTRAGNVIVVAGAEAQLEGVSGERRSFEPPSELVARAARVVASPLLFRPDNVVRWVETLQHDAEGRTAYPALAAALVQERASTMPERLMINWAGPAGSVATLPFEDVYSGTADVSVVRDRYVLIGVTDEMKDLFSTPVGPMSGVEIHAQAAATLLSGQLIRESSNLLGLLIALAASVGIALVGRGRRQWWTWGLTALLALAWFGLGAVVFARALVLLPLTGVALSILGTGVLISALQSEAALGALARLRPTWVKQEGEQLEVTVLVCDMAGYTARSEEASPAELMALMREFFAIVDNVVAPLGGVAARRPGDAALVFFRPEQGRSHHAARALAAARALRDRLHERWPDDGLRFGITLTTGEVSLGWVGEAPPEPQILGDPVNVAFRLQSECRERGLAILADWPTTSADPEVAAKMRHLGEVQVRNRRQPVQIFTPADE